MNKYAIWNKTDTILTPIGEVLPAEKWIERYPIAGVESITVVCAGGEINGAFFGTLGQMVDMYTKEGCDFSACETAEDKLPPSKPLRMHGKPKPQLPHRKPPQPRLPTQK